MSERQKVWETVYAVSCHDWERDERPPGNLLAFNEWLTRLILAVPEEHRSDAEVKIEAESEWNWGEHDSLLVFEVGYRRPETDEEMAVREKREADRKALEVAREKQVLATLKAKYESQ